MLRVGLSVVIRTYDAIQLEQLLGVSWIRSKACRIWRSRCRTEMVDHRAQDDPPRHCQHSPQPIGPSSGDVPHAKGVSQEDYVDEAHGEVGVALEDLHDENQP